jgi:hypothetical protein
MEAPTRTCVPATWPAYEATSDVPPPRRESITAVDVLGLSNRDAANGVAECADFSGGTRRGNGWCGASRTQDSSRADLRSCWPRNRTAQTDRKTGTRCMAVGGREKHP